MKKSLLNSPVITQKLIFVIKVSSFLFVLNSFLYIYNPYFLMRPLQIQEDNNVGHIYSSASANNIHKVPTEIFNLLDISPSEGSNFSTTAETRERLFFQGIGNCSQLSSGMGLVLNRYGYNYSIVHFLPKTGLYSGYGHSILNVILDSISFLVDPVLRTLPIVEYRNSGMQLINFNNLSSRLNINNIKSYKSNVALNNNFWNSDFVLAYAEVSQSDMNNYFRYTKLLRNLLGLDDSKFKRTLVNAIMAVFWRLPTFKVNHDDYVKLCRAYSSFIFLKYLAHFFICNLYCLVFMLFIKVIKFINSKLSLTLNID